METREIRIDQIKARLDKATPGPWKAYDWPGFPRRDEYKDGCVRIENATTITAFCFDGKPNHDALLIAHAPEDIQYLLTLCERQAKALEKCKEQRDEWIYNSAGDDKLPVEHANAELSAILEGKGDE